MTARCGYHVEGIGFPGYVCHLRKNHDGGHSPIGGRTHRWWLSAWHLVPHPRGKPHLRVRIDAARHELRCRKCRVTWRSWWQRLSGDAEGYAP